MGESRRDGEPQERIGRVFEQQADAFLNQANPVSGTKYEVLATNKRVRIIGIAVSSLWTVQPTPLEIHVTIDGIAYKWTQTDPVDGSWYMCPLDARFAETAQEMAAGAALSSAFVLEGRTVKVEAEITGGTVSNLTARVKWGKIP